MGALEVAQELRDTIEELKLVILKLKKDQNNRGRNIVEKNIVICDIDGCISKIGERLKYIKQSPKDWTSFYSSCFDDEPIQEIMDLVVCLENSGYNIIFCTGRRESSRFVTTRWLREYFPETFEYEALLMRPNDDFRQDAEVKIEQCNNYGIDFDAIKFVLEDRDSMVKAWRELGIKCLQVAEGNF